METVKKQDEELNKAQNKVKQIEEKEKEKENEKKRPDFDFTHLVQSSNDTQEAVTNETKEAVTNIQKALTDKVYNDSAK